MLGLYHFVHIIYTRDGQTNWNAIKQNLTPLSFLVQINIFIKATLVTVSVVRKITFFTVSVSQKKEKDDDGVRKESWPSWTDGLILF